MEQMTLARALRYKKRVIETIRRLEQDIDCNNSKVEGEEREADVRLSLMQRSAWVKHLVELKLALQAKTRPIQRLVLELAETKAEIVFLQRLTVQHGTQQSHYRDEPSFKFTAMIRKGERDKMVQDLQDRIDSLQTQMDAFNMENMLEVASPELP